MFGELKSILVVGDVMLDEYIIGKVHRISPEAPVPIVHVQEEKSALGGSANVAHNLANLTINVSLSGVIGRDMAGERVKKLLTEKNIQNLLYESQTTPTTRKVRIMGERQQMLRLDYEKSGTIQKIEAHIQQIISEHQFDAIILSDYGKGVCSNSICRKIIAEGRENNVYTLIDPKGTDWEKYRKAFILTPNLKELQDSRGKKIPNQDKEITEEAKIILKHFELENILVTRSEKGMTLVTNQNEVHHFPAIAQEVFDVSGAGDTVMATLGAFLSQGFSLLESITWANRAAGIVVKKAGTYAISMEELTEKN